MNARHRSVLVHVAEKNVLRDNFEYRVIGRIGECSVEMYDLEEMGFVTLRRDGSYALTSNGAQLAQTLIENKRINRAARVTATNAATTLTFQGGNTGADHS